MQYSQAAEIRLADNEARLDLSNNNNILLQLWEDKKYGHNLGFVLLPYYNDSKCKQQDFIKVDGNKDFIVRIEDSRVIIQSDTNFTNDQWDRRTLDIKGSTVKEIAKNPSQVSKM